jgi:hypothetical protein
MTIDADDNLVIACWIDNGLNAIEAQVGKYDQDGDAIWTDVFGSQGSEQALGVGVGVDGSVVVTGTWSDLDAFVRRYTADGNLEWHDDFNLGSNCRGFDIEFLADGRIAAMVNTNNPGRWLRLYTGAGAEVWTYEQFTGQGYGVAADGNDVIVSGSSTYDPPTAWFAKLSGIDGSVAWEKGWQGMAASMAYDVAIDSMGRVIAVGYKTTQNAVLITTRKYTPDAASLLWEQTMDGPVFGIRAGHDVAVDSDDNVLVAGWTQVGINNDYEIDAILIKYAG